MEAKNDRNGIQVIARAAAILRILRDDPSGLSLGQIADRAGLPRSTVQRITGALAAERLVIADMKGGNLRLGPEIPTLAEAAQHNIAEICRPVLAGLAQRTGETTDLAVLRGQTLTFLDQEPGRHRLRTVSSVGEVFPLTTTANGRACLALMPEAEARNRIERELAASGRGGGGEDLMERLKAIRASGLAYDLDEHTEGISAIGIGFADWRGDLHAISVPIPSSRFEEARPVVEAALKGAKETLGKLFRQDVTGG